MQPCSWTTQYGNVSLDLHQYFKRNIYFDIKKNTWEWSIHACWNMSCTVWYSIAWYLIRGKRICLIGLNIWLNTNTFHSFSGLLGPLYIGAVHMSRCQLIVITWFQCLKKLLWVPMGSHIRHLWPRWPSPNVLACLNLNLTQWHPLVAKFSNICHFRHFLRVPRKT